MLRSRREVLRSTPAAVLAALGWPLPTVAQSKQAPPAAARALPLHEMEFPRDHGAHPQYRTEWWYVTGVAHRNRAGNANPANTWAETPPDFGFQVTFFRTRLTHTQGMRSSFAAKQLVFAHAALTDLRASAVPAKRFQHGQRVARASGNEATDLASWSTRTTQVKLRDWSLERSALKPSMSSDEQLEQPNSRYTALVPAATPTEGFGLELRMTSTQSVLLQGNEGWSRKGPNAQQVSGYLTEPQLHTQGIIRLGEDRFDVLGRAWLDHEWSNEVLASGNVGWDWIGMNLDNGSALTAFRIRAGDGRNVWDGGSFRTAMQAKQGTSTTFKPGDVVFRPIRHWRSPASGASYPIEWIVRTPIDFFTVRALHDAQELDSRQSTGAFYWEGLSELLDGNGKRVGLGYLEMTGYTEPLKL